MNTAQRTENTEGKRMNPAVHEGEMYCSCRGQTFSKLTLTTGHIQRLLFTFIIAAGNFTAGRLFEMKSIFLVSKSASSKLMVSHQSHTMVLYMARKRGRLFC